MIWLAKRRLIIVVAGLFLSVAAAQAEPLENIWDGTQWGESSRALLAHFGGRATVLPRPLDFGDSYADLVLRDVTLGGVPLIAYFQMDKRTGGAEAHSVRAPAPWYQPAGVSRDPRGARVGLRGT